MPGYQETSDAHHFAIHAQLAEKQAISQDSLRSSDASRNFSKHNEITILHQVRRLAQEVLVLSGFARR